MFTLVVIVHVVACLLLITIILMQSGRGGGLTESFAGAESIFGTKTNSFMVKTTSVLAIIFLCTCIGLAVLSTKASRSLLQGEKLQQQEPLQGKALPIKAGEPKPVGISGAVSPATPAQSGVVETEEAKPIEPTNPKDIVPENSPKQAK